MNFVVSFTWELPWWPITTTQHMFLVENNHLPLISDFLISTAPMWSWSSGTFPRTHLKPTNLKYPNTPFSTKAPNFCIFPTTHLRFQRPHQLQHFWNTRAEEYRARSYLCTKGSSNVWRRVPKCGHSLEGRCESFSIWTLLLRGCIGLWRVICRAFESGRPWSCAFW